MPTPKIEGMLNGLATIILVVFRELADMNEMVELVSNCLAVVTGMLAIVSFWLNIKSKLKKPNAPNQ